MLGHEPLIEMRRARLMPDVVTIETDSRAGYEVRHWRKLHPAYPFLHIGPDEKVNRLDLRVLVSLPVYIRGKDKSRIEQIASAVIAAKASKVRTDLFNIYGDHLETKDYGVAHG